jgi:PAS domain S-box-containing protein
LVLFFQQNNNRAATLIWVLVAVIFVADIFLPDNFNIAFAYLVAHFLAVFFRNKNDVLLLAVITTTLTVAAAALKTNEIPLEQAFLERVLPVMSFWAAAYFVVQFIDLREQEEQQKERFETLFQFAVTGILLTNREGTILMANPALKALFGYEKGELVGRRVEMLIPARFAQRHEGHREAYHGRPHARSMGVGLDLMGLKKDGTEFPVEVSLGPFRSGSEQFVVAFVTDNTFRKSYETSILEQKQALTELSEALKQANDDLEDRVLARTTELEAAKLDLEAALAKERELGELKNRFVSMASHEFRTPLTTVLSSAALAEQYAGRQDFAQVTKHMGRIKNAVNGLNGILADFLSVGRLEEGGMRVSAEMANLPKCVAEVHDTLKNIFKPGQALTHRHSGPEEAYIDCHLTKNILINLISNAIKYSPENAPITVESDADAEQGTVRISVRDKGMGIPPSEQKHLFDRFFRASNAVNSTQGTGLGLYIVKRYAEAMGGTVGFESSEAEGTVFWVEIPRD